MPHSRRRKRQPFNRASGGESSRHRHKPVHAVGNGKTVGAGTEPSRPTKDHDAFGQYGSRTMIATAFQSPIQDPGRICPSPDHQTAFRRFQRLVRQLARPESRRRFVFADIHDLLVKLGQQEFSGAVKHGPDVALSPFRANYLCGMVEYAAGLKGVRPPSWTAHVAPLRNPWFGTDLERELCSIIRRGPLQSRGGNIY